MKTICTQVFAVICCIVSVAAAAQSDELDSTFGVNGKVRTLLGSGSTPYDIAVQLNKKIVVAGVSFNGADNDFALARYKPNGQLDASFGTGGKVITDLGGDETGRSVNGWNSKIIVAGTCSQGFCLIRYKTLGSVDSAFGNNGKAITDFGGDGGYCYASAIQSDGKIIAVGASAGNFVIVRYRVNGKIDRTFGVKGILIADSAKGYFRAATAVALQPDGKIIAAGYSGPFGLRKFLVVRINTNGTLDSTFGKNGKTYTDFSNFFGLDNLAFAVAIGANGKIYAAGQSSGNETNNYSEFSVARYNKNGRLDRSFSGDGKVLTNFDEFDDGANAIVIMPDGKIIVAGTLYSQNRTGIIRYNPDGSPDVSFGNNGKLTTNYKRTTSAILQSDGKLLVSADDEFTIVRYKSEQAAVAPATRLVEFAGTKIKPAEITLSPNPVKNFIKINNLNTSGRSALSIIDASGKTLLRATTTGNNFTWNMQSLKTGVYYLHIATNGHITDLKFMKE